VTVDNVSRLFLDAGLTPSPNNTTKKCAVPM
jgi:hypothetical protein